MSEKIAIIGASEFQNPLIIKAKELGFEAHVFAWASGDIGEKTADFFYPISIVEKEQILEICKKLNPVAVVSVGSDLAVITVNYISRALGLPCNPPETDLCATNKILMRQAFQKHGVKTPFFLRADENFGRENLKKLCYPLIVKPTDRSGSRGICLVKNYDEAYDAIQNACKKSFEKCAIIEELIPGEEYSCECISQNGIHHILAFTKKYTTNEPDYIETAHLEPVTFSPWQTAEIKREIIKGLDALHITVGASHPEFRIDADGQVRIIEIGARMGGDCIGTHLVPLSSGYDFTKMVIDAACGKPVDLSCREQKKVAYIRFIMNENDLAILKTIRQTHPEYLQYVSKIDVPDSQKITDSSTRLGFFILQCSQLSDLSQFGMELV